MKNLQVKSKGRAIAKARRIVERDHYSNDGNKRKWLTTFVDSYKNKKYRVELHIWEGSPTRGYVVVGHDTATAFNIGDNVIGKVEWGN